MNSDLILWIHIPEFIYLQIHIWNQNEFMYLWIHMIFSYLNSYSLSIHMIISYIHMYMNSYSQWIHMISSHMNSYEFICIWIHIYEFIYEFGCTKVSDGAWKPYFRAFNTLTWILKLGHVISDWVISLRVSDWLLQWGLLQWGPQTLRPAATTDTAAHRLAVPSCHECCCSHCSLGLEQGGPLNGHDWKDSKNLEWTLRPACPAWAQQAAFPGLDSEVWWPGSDSAWVAHADFKFQVNCWVQGKEFEDSGRVHDSADSGPEDLLVLVKFHQTFLRAPDSAINLKLKYWSLWLKGSKPQACLPVAMHQNSKDPNIGMHAISRSLA